MKNMGKKLFVTALMMFIGIASKAQVVILNDSMFEGRMSEIKATVIDSLTNEPVPFASVYVIPAKDTTITNFTLTDAKGVAKLEEVPYGNYVFRVEMMGYKAFVKERYFRERQADMGTIRLQLDKNYLQSATITDVGNPITIKKDTIEFNATSFRVGSNAMLKDLLQRMPGMEITSDGKVKFNGETIDKLTVGGRTFFFNDQSTALNNLPASVVDKIRVIDRESEQTRASGIQDGNREKVLDVGLKKEYEDGWFGNVGLSGGTTTDKKNKPLRDNRGFLYNGNALVSAYSKKDQVTFIANGLNVDNSGSSVVIIDENGERSGLNQGLFSAAQVGLNANTSLIKDVETTVSANYKYSDVNSGSMSERTTYQDDGNLLSSSKNTGKQYADVLNANLELQKEKGKVWFHVRPAFTYKKTDTFGEGSSETSKAGTFVNSSSQNSHDKTLSNAADFEGDIAIRGIGGKKGRNIQTGIQATYNVNSGDSEESSLLKMAGSDEARNMSYDSDGHSYGMGYMIGYTEPIGKKWTLSSQVKFSWSKQNNVRDASDASGRNDYFSSESRNRYMEQSYNLTAQYQLGKRSWLTLGGIVFGVLNETYSKSYGIEDTAGKGEWLWSVSPTMRFIHSKGNSHFNFNLYAYSQRPSAYNMRPVMNIADPSRPSLGNVYLGPSTQSYFYSSWNMNNRERFTSLMVFLDGSLTARPTSYARWYDSDGILYSFPVNARKPRANVSLQVSYTMPLDKKKNWSMTFSEGSALNSSVSYQTKATRAALDKDSFDYSAFMADFWGNAHGNRFYDGLSGFRESSTLSFRENVGVSVKYNQDHYSFRFGANTRGRIFRYSLDKSTNMNTLDTRFFASGSYTTKHEFEFNTELTYAFFNGYAEGYGKPEWRWNVVVSKNIGAFNLSISVNDILNQARNLSHTVTDNYEEDTYTLIMGRYILFGVKWNFGKMNAANSARAQRAAMDMLF